MRYVLGWGFEVPVGLNRTDHLNETNSKQLCCYDLCYLLFQNEQDQVLKTHGWISMVIFLYHHLYRESQPGKNNI